MGEDLIVRLILNLQETIDFEELTSVLIRRQATKLLLHIF